MKDKRIAELEAEIVLAKEDVRRWANIYAEADQERIDLKAGLDAEAKVKRAVTRVLVATEADKARLEKGLRYMADENNWDDRDNDCGIPEMRRPGGAGQEGLVAYSRYLLPRCYADALLPKEDKSDGI